MKKLQTAAIILISWVTYALSFLIPRHEKIWVFIGWHRNSERELFADNSKYLFLHVANNVPRIRPVWIGKDDKICAILENNGYEAYNIHSIRGIYYSLRAGYTFLDALMQLSNWRYSAGTKVIQLWHGKSPKKTGYNSPYSLRKYNKILYPNLFRSVFRFIAISQYLANFVVSDFRIRKKNILITGLPRCDVLFGILKGSDIDTNPKLQKSIEIAKAQHSRKLILYAPTFRPDGSNPLFQLRLSRLNKFLATKNYFFIGSLHPKFSTQDWIPKEIFSNISFVESGYDWYPQLPNFDVLITDYSSLCIDFLIMDKPTIFFAYDLDTYKKEMGLYEDLWGLIPGPHAATFEELLDALEGEDTDIWKQKRHEAQKQLFAFRDGNASERIVEYIQRLHS